MSIENLQKIRSTISTITEEIRDNLDSAILDLIDQLEAADVEKINSAKRELELKSKIKELDALNM